MGPPTRARGGDQLQRLLTAPEPVAGPADENWSPVVAQPRRGETSRAIGLDDDQKRELAHVMARVEPDGRREGAERARRRLCASGQAEEFLRGHLGRT